MEINVYHRHITTVYKGDILRKSANSSTECGYFHVIAIFQTVALSKHTWEDMPNQFF